MATQNLTENSDKFVQKIHTQDGIPATIEVGETITGQPGTDASVANTGTAQNAVLVFTIPKGDRGPTGEAGASGADGVSPTITFTEITGGYRLTITDADGAHSVDLMNGADGATGPQGPQGQAGEAGHSVNVTATKADGVTTLTFTDATTGTVLATATVEDGTEVLTNNNKVLAQARRQVSGNAIYVALIDEDGTYNNVYGLPQGAVSGAYLETDGTINGSAWVSPDTTPAANSARLITSGGVYAAIQAAITNALAASY